MENLPQQPFGGTPDMTSRILYMLVEKVYSNNYSSLLHIPDWCKLHLHQPAPVSCHWSRRSLPWMHHGRSGWSQPEALRASLLGSLSRSAGGKHHTSRGYNSRMSGLADEEHEITTLLHNTCTSEGVWGSFRKADSNCWTTFSRGNTLLLPSLASSAAALLGFVMSNWISLPESNKRKSNEVLGNCGWRVELTCELVPTPVDVLGVLAEASHAEGGLLEG